MPGIRTGGGRREVLAEVQVVNGIEALTGHLHAGGFWALAEGLQQHFAQAVVLLDYQARLLIELVKGKCPSTAQGDRHGFLLIEAGTPFS